METPPTLPPTKPPLGGQFYLILLAPLIVIAIGFCCANLLPDVAGVFLGLGGLSIVACSVILAMQLSRRMGQPDKPATGLGFLLFFAFIAFYGVCFFVGCTAAVMAS